MKDYLANEIRNVVLLGHSESGKSSIIEAALFQTKEIDRMGKTADGNSSSDYDQEEIKRGNSVYSTLIPVEWKNHKINFIDTPGYLDYEGELRAGLSVADNALIVVSAKEGVQAGCDKAFRLATQRKLPTIFFVNKMDDENSSFDRTYNELRDHFGKSVIPFEMPIRENGVVVGSINILRKKAWYYNDRTEPKEVPEQYSAVVDEYYEQIAEAIAMGDDELMEKFFSGEGFDEHEIAKGLRIGVRSGEIRPIYCGSATNCVGIERLLDLIGEYFPSYAEKGTIEAYDTEGNVIQLRTNENEIFSAYVYKTIVDPFVGKISLIKIMTGVLTTDAQVVNVQKEEPEKINQIFIMRGKVQIAVGKLFTGDIGAVIKLQHTGTNDTLACPNKLVTYEKTHYPEPMLGVAIWPKTKADEDKMSFALAKMEEEDRSIRIVRNVETKETVLYAIGDQQIDVVINKLKQKYKVEVTTTKPKVQYRETIRSTITAEGKHKKQTGGAGQYGHVFIRFEPTDSEDMVFDEEVFGGVVPRQYFQPVEHSLRECMHTGVLAGYKVVGVKAVLTGGSYHDVDSKEIAFKAAARLAYKAGMPQAKPMLLEPIGKVTVLIPEEFTGTIIGDINKRRGIVTGMDLVNNLQTVEAEIPMAEMQTYATELRSITQGRGEYLMKFDRYETAPPMVADKVIKEAKANQQED